MVSGLGGGKTQSTRRILRWLQEEASRTECYRRENVARSLKRVRELRNKGRVRSNISKGDKVMLHNNARLDSLEPRYYGPYEVMDRTGPDVKIRIHKEVRNRSGRRYTRYKNKWVHLDRCKEYYRASEIVHPPRDQEFEAPKESTGPVVATESRDEEHPKVEGANNAETIPETVQEDIVTDSSESIDEAQEQVPPLEKNDVIQARLGSQLNCMRGSSGGIA